MGDIVVSVDLLKAPILVSKVTSLSIGAEFLPVKLPAVLRLVLIVSTLFLALTHIQWMIFAQLLGSMCKLALVAVATDAVIGPVFADLTLVHGALYEALLSVLGVV